MPNLPIQVRHERARLVTNKALETGDPSFVPAHRLTLRGSSTSVGFKSDQTRFLHLNARLLHIWKNITHLLLLGQLLRIAHQAACVYQQELAVAPKGSGVQPARGTVVARQRFSVGVGTNATTVPARRCDSFPADLSRVTPG